MGYCTWLCTVQSGAVTNSHHHRAMLHHAMSCHVMLCPALPGSAMLCKPRRDHKATKRTKAQEGPERTNGAHEKNKANRKTKKNTERKREETKSHAREGRANAEIVLDGAV